MTAYAVNWESAPMPSLRQEATWYLTEQLPLDRCLAQWRSQVFMDYVQGPLGLELGPADGETTHLLLPLFQSLTIVDQASVLLDKIPDTPSLTKICTPFALFTPTHGFHTILLDHVLEHVEDPRTLLRQCHTWCLPGGVLLVGIPNGYSLHRILGTVMGMLPHPCAFTAADRRVGHQRIYTLKTIRGDLKAAGWTIRTWGGRFLKPFSVGQLSRWCAMSVLFWLFRLGRYLPWLAADLFFVCTHDE